MQTRRQSLLVRVLIVVALAAGPVIVIAAVLLSSDSSKAPPPPPLPPPIHAGAVDRTTVYHSPQTPGYTAWVGAWLMPDDSMMTGFVQATGPVDPAQRPRTPAAVSKLFDTGVATEPDRDFWGLELSSRFLRSRDDGQQWTPVRTERFRAIAPFGYTAQANMALKDGTIIRRINGDDLRQDKSIPHTAFLQRLAPGAKRWSKPQLLLDPRKQTYQLTRIKYLRDGRLVATGNVWNVPADTPLRERARLPGKFLLMVSGDEGRTWRNGLEIPAAVGDLQGGEWDTGELPNGDLAAVLRVKENQRDARKQALLRPSGGRFVMTDVKPAPMPHSGHPELLATREGPVLDIATTGVSYTRDGMTWQPLRFAGSQGKYVSEYYPRSLQTRDGVVHVFGHRGHDNPYGNPDQAIIMDSFRLAGGR